MFNDVSDNLDYIKRPQGQHNIDWKPKLQVFFSQSTKEGGMDLQGRGAYKSIDNPEHILYSVSPYSSGSAMKKYVTLIIAAMLTEIIIWYKSHFKEYQTAINAVLKSYMKTQGK